jgi:hypothetical protein
MRKPPTIRPGVIALPRRRAGAALAVALTIAALSAAASVAFVIANHAGSGTEPAPTAAHPASQHRQPAPGPREDRFHPASTLRTEVVAAGTSTGEGGNPWGGHQSRIVRTAHGLFTIYTTDGTDELHRVWKLAWRYHGEWRVIASGQAGEEPPALLAAPSGKLYVIAWPEPFNAPGVWSGTPRNGAVTMSGPVRPAGPWATTYAPYQGAAVAPDGAVYTTQSIGVGLGEARDFVWARRDPSTGAWTSHLLPIGDGRYTYPYLLPDPSGPGLTIVADRDNLWTDVGYTKPARGSGSNYVFNRVRWWHTDDASAATPTFSSLIVAEEEPTGRHPEPFAMTEQSGAILDSAGRTHVLYAMNGASTRGRLQIRHAVIANGVKVDDRVVPGQGNGFVRLAINAKGQLIIIGSRRRSTLNVWPVPDPSKAAVGKARSVNVGATVKYAGLMAADPRGGTPPSATWDLGFPTGPDGSTWRYAKLRLPVW